MLHDPITTGRRKPVNLTLDSGVIDFAREMGINLSRVSEAALQHAAQEELARRWKEENREALATWSRWMDENGSPLDRHRAF